MGLEAGGLTCLDELVLALALLLEVMTSLEIHLVVSLWLVGMAPLWLVPFLQRSLE